MWSCILVFELVISSVRRCISRTCSSSVWKPRRQSPREATLLALARRQDKPVAADAAGGRFYGRNLQWTGPPAAARALLHTRAERGHLRCAQSDEPLAHPPLVLLQERSENRAGSVIEAVRDRAVSSNYRYHDGEAQHYFRAAIKWASALLGGLDLGGRSRLTERRTRPPRNRQLLAVGKSIRAHPDPPSDIPRRRGRRQSLSGAPLPLGTAPLPRNPLRKCPPAVGVSNAERVVRGTLCGSPLKNHSNSGGPGATSSLWTSPSHTRHSCSGYRSRRDRAVGGGGSGPTPLSGKGELVFAVNDDVYGDNEGHFEVAVSYTTTAVTRTCWPGWGYGDTTTSTAFRQVSPTSRLRPAASQPTHGHSDEHGNSQENRNSKNKSEIRKRGEAATSGAAPTDSVALPCATNSPPSPR